MIHRLGSLNFALVLLASIAVLCAVATITESRVSTRAAQAFLYRNPLFLLWLAALCVNLFAVTLTRWPWKKKHAGFVVTHYGIITLLAGAAIGMQTGFEGNVTLRKDAPPAGRVTTSRSIIQLQSPADSALYLMGFDAEMARPSAKRTRVFEVPRTDLRVVADDFSSNLVREPRLVPAGTADARPGVLLKLSSATASRSVDVPLVLRNGEKEEHDFFGLARIVLRQQLGPPPETPASETQMVFAKYAPITHAAKGPSGVTVRLSEDGEKVSIFGLSGGGATYRRAEIMNQPLSESGARVVVDAYWPDFAMENGQPVSRSDSPKNPAVLVRILSADSPTQSILELAPAGEGLEYRLRRGSQVSASGVAAVGTSFALGWADWRADVLQVLPKAGVESDVKPGPATGEPGIPGFRAHLEGPNGLRGPDRWIVSGEVTALRAGQHEVLLGYGLETRPLPFSLRLLAFDVPRDEGTDTPADFRATIEFKDSRNGAIKTGVARMNHPASFPGTWLANLTGVNYKFSQAEWNPNDLAETTLQVLYDPGWLLKWIGSLAIVAGIAIMFYWKPGAA